MNAVLILQYSLFIIIIIIFFMCIHLKRKITFIFNFEDDGFFQIYKQYFVLL